MQPAFQKLHNPWFQSAVRGLDLLPKSLGCASINTCTHVTVHMLLSHPESTQTGKYHNMAIFEVRNIQLSHMSRFDRLRFLATWWVWENWENKQWDLGLTEDLSMIYILNSDALMYFFSFPSAQKLTLLTLYFVSTPSWWLGHSQWKKRVLYIQNRYHNFRNWQADTTEEDKERSCILNPWRQHTGGAVPTCSVKGSCTL